jgi:DNA-binding protein HU-beta
MSLSCLYRVLAGEKVTLLGFGSFERVVRAARAGRNPSTGETMQIAEKAAPTFRASKVFKDTVATAHRS